MSAAREVQLVETFVVPTKRARYAAFVSSSKDRAKFLRGLHHFGDFEPACVVPLSGRSDSADGLVAELRRRGAADPVYLVSALRELDGQVMPLDEAIREVFAMAEGTIVCCAPGRLAYYEGEAPKNRFILQALHGKGT